MTVIPTRLANGAGEFDRNSGTAARPVAVPPSTPATRAPVLVTEEQVMFASAVAISTPAGTRPHTNPFRTLAHLFTWPSGTPRPTRRRYPPRTPSWYSDALMAREMYRL